MRCPYCLREIETPPCRMLPEKIFIEVREKKIGFTGKIDDGHLRFFAALPYIWTELKDAINAHKFVPEGVIYECKMLASRDLLKGKEKKE